MFTTIERCLLTIATCEVIRTVQLFIQMEITKKHEKAWKDSNNAFINSLNVPNKKWVNDMLKAYEEEEKK